MATLKKVFIFFTFSSLCFSAMLSQQVTYDWKHVIPGNTYTALCCMATDSSGNMYVGGRLDSTIVFLDTTVTNTYNTGFLAKLNPDGDLVWFKQFRHSETVYSMCFDSENMLYISGSYLGKVQIDDTLLYTWDADTTYFGMFLAKFNTDGNRIWAKTTAGSFYYESGYGKLKQMTIDKDDNIVVISYAINEIEYFDTTVTYTKTLDSLWVTTPFPHWEYFYDQTNVLVKFNKHGQKLWIKDLGMHQQHYLAIATDYSNNILLTGYFWDDYPFVIDSVTLTSTSSESIFVIKYNPLGHLIWAQKAGGGSNGNKAYDIISDENDNVFVTGIISGGNVEFGGNVVHPGLTNQLFLTKYSPSGVVEWFRHIGTEGNSSNYDRGLGLFIFNNEILLCGFFFDSLNLGFTILNTYIYPWRTAGIFLKFDLNGNLIGAVMDHDYAHFLPIYISTNNLADIYISGNMSINSSQDIVMGKFSGWFLTENKEEPTLISDFFIMPNPCNNYFYIAHNETDGSCIELYDISGKPVLSQKVNGSLCTVDASWLSKGIYIVKINNKVSKLIKN